MTINEKLSQIQVRFKSKKSRFNSFGKYYFRSAEDILEAIKPFNKELGVYVTINEELVANEPVPVLKTTATLWPAAIAALISESFRPESTKGNMIVFMIMI